eukprot:TRINITY_DN31156_c0_g1_i1.p1 TRINITY_DN31156_c0_g1~~TRINITY_DN31156_c0_g1_i1.p1  ORF type:complete len:1684 (+),score=300.69 TRINITY_DN31156_c0_g1_i1:465-5054(+)
MDEDWPSEDENEDWDDREPEPVPVRGSVGNNWRGSKGAGRKGSKSLQEQESWRRKAYSRDNGSGGSWEKKKPYSWAKATNLEDRPLLPIQEKRDEVVPVLCGEFPVVCLLGETGCGKSTQVPQILLEEAKASGQHVRIAVSQPRRVAALNLAHRVAAELGEDCAGQGRTVGYRIGGESVRGEHVDFCTTGFLLQLFLNSPEDLGQYTHIILDEVHERSAESDMLCLVVRLLISNRFRNTRLIVMSATLQSDLFANYFRQGLQGEVGKVFVGARCFEVTTHYLDDLPTAFNQKLRTETTIKTRIKEVFSEIKEPGSAKKIDVRHCDKFQVIILELLEVIAEPGSTILVFLPGIAEISSLWEEARVLEDNGRFKVFPLHSMVPREEQELVFQEPDPQVTNVVLATDIAESSITLPHVVAVIDLGLHRRMDHDVGKGIATLATKWISKAAAKQRNGRAGRTQPGLCIRLYPKEFFEKGMNEFEPPESSVMSLDRLYLQAKQLAEKMCKVALDGAPSTAQGLLTQMVEAPNLATIKTAREKNALFGTISAPTEAASITTLGRLCLQLPIDLKLARLVWLGAHWGVAADAVVLASVLSSQDPFSMPSPLFMHDERDFVERLRAATSARLLFDGGVLSEPLMQRQLFLEWLAEFHESQWVWGDKDKVFWARRKHTQNFSWHYSLSKGRMEHVVSHVLDLSLRVFRACVPGSTACGKLRELIRGLGYIVDKRGDLSGIPWKEWRVFKRNEAFEADTTYLKSLLAAAFTHNLFIGSYSPTSRELEVAPAAAAASAKSSSKLTERLEVQQREMERQECKPRQTVCFAKGSDGFAEDPGAYVEFVCGARPNREPIECKLEGGEEMQMLELQLENEAARWQPLKSRAEAPLLISPKRLPAEFNLLFQFEKAMKDLQRSRSKAGWTYGAVSINHPHILKWEWLEPAYTPKGLPLRIEGSFERKNAVGIIGHVQPLEQNRLKRVALFAVAANVRGGEQPNRTFPEGVTTLAAGHIAFVLACGNLEMSQLGLRRFGFTLSGAFAVLHRCVDIPAGCVDKTRWEKIRALRDALQGELKMEEACQEQGSSWEKDPPLLYDSPVMKCAWELFQAVPHDDDGPDATLAEDYDTMVHKLAHATVNLEADSSQGGDSVFEALRPLADWSTLVARRNQLDEYLRQKEREKEIKAQQQRQSDHSRAPPRDEGGRRDRDRDRERERERERDRKRPADDRALERRPEKTRRHEDSGRGRRSMSRERRGSDRTAGGSNRDTHRAGDRTSDRDRDRRGGGGDRTSGGDGRSERDRGDRGGQRNRERSVQEKSRHRTGRGITLEEFKKQNSASKDKVRSMGLYDLLKEVIDRWGDARDDEVSDDRFRAAIHAALESQVLMPRELEQVEVRLKKVKEDMTKRGRRPRGRGEPNGPLHTPAPLAEMEQRVGLSGKEEISSLPVLTEAGAVAARSRSRDGDLGPESGLGRLPPRGGSAGSGGRENDHDIESRGEAETMGDVEYVEGAPNWMRCRDEEGSIYYFNEETGESTWELPSGAG